MRDTRNTKTNMRKHKTDIEDNNQQSDAQRVNNNSETDEDRSPTKSIFGQSPAKKKRANFTMIVKPDCQSQGNGIFLTHDLDAIPLTEQFVVQEYVQEPYLIDGLKFDLRLYVLVLSCEPLRIFLY